MGLLGLLTGCSGLHPVDSSPPPVASLQDRFQKGASSRDSRLGTSAEAWWTTFRDPALGRLTDAALGKNLELRAVASRIDQASARLRQANASLFPVITGEGVMTMRWTDGARADTSSAGTLLDWEVDVWGRLRALRNARRRETDASVEDWLGARLFLSAAVAETYFEILEQRLQLQLIEEQAASNQTLLDLTKLRFGQGQTSIVDVLQQQQLLESTLARGPVVQTRLEQLQLALGVLLGGENESQAGAGVKELKSPPALPAAGLPSDLLLARPDLRALEDRIVALDHEVGAAIAERFPQFTIGGAIAAAGTPGIEALTGNAFAALTGPIFEAGSRKAEVDFRRARLEEAVNGYGNAVLVAVQEVETALVQERRQAERVVLLAQQLETARRLLQESQNRYSNGLTDYLPVLDALSRLQDLERDYLTSRRQRLSFRVALHRALGGPMPLPSPNPP